MISYNIKCLFKARKLCFVLFFGVLLFSDIKNLKKITLRSTTNANDLTVSQNLAISENGLLPYQLCGSNESFIGAGVAFSSFTYKGVEQLIAISASSSWGIGAKLPRVEFLSYFRPNKTNERCPADEGGHCELLPRGGPIMNPNVTCRVVRHGSLPRRGFFSIPAADSLKSRFNGVFSVLNIMCPSLELDLLPNSQSQVEIYIGDEGTRTFALNICYIPVSTVRRASVCVAPVFGIGSTYHSDLNIWRGITSVWPNG